MDMNIEAGEEEIYSIRQNFGGDAVKRKKHYGREVYTKGQMSMIQGNSSTNQHNRRGYNNHRICNCSCISLGLEA